MHPPFCCLTFHSFIPIVVLALVFNVTNVIGFTYAYVDLHQDLDVPSKSVCRDRDAKQRWANQVSGGAWSLGLGGIGGQLITGAVQKGVGRLFG